MNREAPHGDRTIKLTVTFRTNAIAEEKGHIVPKNAWTDGNVGFVANPSHDIKASESIRFDSLAELSAKIEELIIREGITLHTSHKMEKYISQDE